MAQDVNLVNARRYAQAGAAAQRANDWQDAREKFRRAVINARDGRAHARMLAGLLYEYGRSSGVVCKYEEAEASLKEAFTLEQDNRMMARMDLVELARLNFDQGKFDRAGGYFAQAIPLLEGTNARKDDPLGFADILDEYSVALRNTGRTAEADQVAVQGKGLRAKNPQRRTNTDRTPYGKYCR
jgi:tetratricopeptide (TPR) repeat protein